MEQRTIVWGLCGSFCTFGQILPRIEAAVQRGSQVIPIMSFNAASMDTRFGRAQEWKERLELATGCRPLETLQQAEPLGPKELAQAMVIAPCTGNTLAKLAAGISDTPVTLAAKSMLRNGKPVVLAISTNDALLGSLQNLATLLARKHFYVVPFAQDDYLRKPYSMQSDFDLIEDTLESALRGRQLGPLLNI